MYLVLSSEKNVCVCLDRTHRVYAVCISYMAIGKWARIQNIDFVNREYSVRTVIGTFAAFVRSARDKMYSVGESRTIC